MTENEFDDRKGGADSPEEQFSPKTAGGVAVFPKKSFSHSLFPYPAISVPIFDAGRIGEIITMMR
ncbi:hypothetical protein [Noviherbaspirillum massiliense]|uniref:hypothetical protein n=1 Tax=Noviherbaspirillum massiliense TaxID=1465823 RepID=UPI0002F45693|nr:hypothetical protein [Noviherbaspirillum massiliense]